MNFPDFQINSSSVHLRVRQLSVCKSKYVSSVWTRLDRRSIVITPTQIEFLDMRMTDTSRPQLSRMQNLYFQQEGFKKHQCVREAVYMLHLSTRNGKVSRQKGEFKLQLLLDIHRSPDISLNFLEGLQVRTQMSRNVAPDIFRNFSCQTRHFTLKKQQMLHE